MIWYIFKTLLDLDQPVLPPKRCTGRSVHSACFGLYQNWTSSFQWKICWLFGSSQTNKIAGSITPSNTSIIHSSWEQLQASITTIVHSIWTLGVFIASIVHSVQTIVKLCNLSFKLVGKCSLPWFIFRRSYRLLSKRIEEPLQSPPMDYGLTTQSPPMELPAKPTMMEEDKRTASHHCINLYHGKNCWSDLTMVRGMRRTNLFWRDTRKN
jgi:hypothetical protein